MSKINVLTLRNNTHEVHGYPDCRRTAKRLFNLRRENPDKLWKAQLVNTTQDFEDVESEFFQIKKR